MAIINSSKIFKPSSSKLTELRINMVFQYIIYCYLKMCTEGKKYNYKERGSLQHEDFLRDGLVNDYLSKKSNKDFYKNNISDNPNVEISFHPEEGNTYNNVGTLKNDYIDIAIYENRLSDIWGSKTEDQIKFAVECKRIKVTNDYTQYINDIQKFADRSFTSFRLPFEGQIAFIENDKLNHTIVHSEINKRLETLQTISTINQLKEIKLDSKFSGCYSSQHNRNYGDKSPFFIKHLLFDYSTTIIN